ncbi:AsnC family transcriptional regulator [Gymnodinialimonas sp. 2305UL16-5]|uniref:Lrp/AsnC family transcriptional regulator n=1 Tax=Gymnodinialimonas mytili TaxID=3126503 RepID=UPI0030B35984
MRAGERPRTGATWLPRRSRERGLRGLDLAYIHNARQNNTAIWRSAMSETELDAKKKDRSIDRLRSEESGLDKIDAAILRELCADARIPRAELSRRAGLSAPSVADRVRRLEDVGIITGYGARIDPARLG